jgi:hypothetical protein
MNKFHVVSFCLIFFTLKTTAQDSQNKNIYSFEHLPVVKSTAFKTDSISIINMVL